MILRLLDLRILPFLILALATAACDDNPVEGGPDPIEATLVEDLPADPPTGVDPVTGRPVGTGRYTLFSLRENRIVQNADSATTAWDLAFNATTVLTNGGSSGPGEGGAVILALPFEDVLEAPSDAEIHVDETGAPAVKQSAAGDWYNYNPQTNVVTPVPGRTLVVRTADGRYAKIRIVSYYRGAPDVIGDDSESRYYTFDYVFQSDGSRSLQSAEVE